MACGTLFNSCHFEQRGHKNMLFKKDPRKKLTKAYQQKMEEAMKAMRNGDVRSNAYLVKEAEEIKSQLDQLS